MNKVGFNKRDNASIWLVTEVEFDKYETTL